MPSPIGIALYQRLYATINEYSDDIDDGVAGVDVLDAFAMLATAMAFKLTDSGEEAQQFLHDIGRDLLGMKLVPLSDDNPIESFLPLRDDPPTEH